MLFAKGKMYKVIEIRGGLAIIDINDNVKGQNACPLMAADGETICEYLLRYIHAREDGKTLKEAHDQALRGAQIKEVGHLDTSDQDVVLS